MNSDKLGHVGHVGLVIVLIPVESDPGPMVPASCCDRMFEKIIGY